MFGLGLSAVRLCVLLFGLLLPISAIAESSVSPQTESESTAETIVQSASTTVPVRNRRFVESVFGTTHRALVPLSVRQPPPIAAPGHRFASELLAPIRR